MVKVRKQLARAMCLLLALQTASCSNSTKTESSSSLASGDPSLQSETTESLEDTSSGTETEMSLPSVCPNCEQSETENVEQDFNLTFCDDLQVFDYGKETVNVYRAEYDDYIQLSDSFFTEWFTHPSEFGLLTKWATGRPFSYSPEIRSVDDFNKYDGIPTETRSFQCKDGVTVKRNIQNVEMVALKDIEDGEELAKECGLDVNSPILYWKYTIVDLPKDEAVKSFFVDEPIDSNIFDMEMLNYAQIRAQYVDNIPISNEWDNFYYCTYEWPGVIEPSRPSDSCSVEFSEYLLDNPSATYSCELTTQRYRPTEVIQSDLPVIDPLDCLDGIKDTILYQPSAITNDWGLLGPWGKDIEIYCMELAYFSLDPNPSDMNESQESKAQHSMYLVPVWKAYYTCTDPKSNMIIGGSLMINAVTGETLFSSTIGQGMNEDLYKDLYMEG